jgi:nucleoside-diphosphate-sugar epimerase
MAGRALITGLAGFTGAYVARELAALGYEVVGLDGDAAVTAGHHGLDLRDGERLRAVVAELQPQVVVHLAAIAFVAHGDASDIYASNILGTRNLLAALSAVGSPPEKVLRQDRPGRVARRAHEGERRREQPRAADRAGGARGAALSVAPRS